MKPMNESIKDCSNLTLEQHILTNPLETNNILDSSTSASEHKMPGFGYDECQNLQKELQFDESTCHEKFANQKDCKKKLHKKFELCKIQSMLKFSTFKQKYFIVHYMKGGFER